MLSDPPAPDVVEVSIFGPGKGECVVVHLGNREWIIVDSCVDQLTKTIPALEYLRRIGVDVASEVHLVVSTHAHDDHFAGIAEVFQTCHSARFVCSDAATLDEILAHAKLPDVSDIPLRTSTYQEFRKVIEIVRSRGASRPGFRPLKYASELKELHTRNAGTSPATVIALSPSDTAIARSRQRLADAYPAVRDRRRPTSIDPNELSVALWITVADKSMLLGADLLNGPADCGWAGVLAAIQSSQRAHVYRNASVFKVPHHGAPNAHDDEVWSMLLNDSPVALLAPYRAGRLPRPHASDQERICALTTRAFITASPRIPAPRRPVQREAAKLTAVARNIREPWGRSGHVRARSRIGDQSWTVHTDWPARRLCD